MSFELVRYSQRDPKWRDDKLGTSDLTMGHSGCAVASIAMLLRGHGYTETPGSLNNKLRQLGGFMGAAIVWGSVTGLYPRALFKNTVICRDSDAPIDQITASIQGGQPVLLEVDYSPQSGLQTHWVVAYKRQGEDFLVLDPYPYPTEDNVEVSLMQRFAHGKNLKRAITAAVFYQVQDANYTPPPPEPLEPGAFYIQVVGGLGPTGLRLRSQPTTASETLSFLGSGAVLRVLEPESVARPKVGVFNQWIHVRALDGSQGYVAAWFIELGPVSPPHQPEPPAPPTPEPIPPTPEPTPPTPPDLPVQRVKPSVGDGLEDVLLEASLASQLTPQADTNSPTHRLVANIYNRYGGLLEAFSQVLGIEPAVAVATLAVESGGQAFASDGRMIIRFENHVFYNQWGKNNQAKFAQHFTYNSSQAWSGHKWRPSPDQPWQPPNLPDFHGNQSREWEVFNFAASLDDTAAKMSISMGAPQIMGFNFGLIGFASVQDMFKAFTQGERDQVIGFFDFVQYVSPNAVKALRTRDFKTFAAYYNGSGQAVMYGNLIKTAYDAFNQLRTAQPAPPPPPPPVPQPQPEPEPEPDPTPPQPEPEPTPAPKPEKIFIKISASVGTNGLRFRRQPGTSGALIAVLPAGTSLESLDPPAMARSKIGRNGQWLWVQDARGRQGYVAAWFVELDREKSQLNDDNSDPQPEPTPPPVPQPEPEPTPPQPEPEPEPTPPTPDPQPEPEPTPPPEKEDIFVIVSNSVGSSGLRLRAVPSAAGRLVTVLPAGSRLRVLDDPDAAKSKVGQNNAWLWVMDRQDREGYVAAWFVALEAGEPQAEEAENDSSDETNIPEIEIEPLTVYVSSLVGIGGLRMRSEPNTSSRMVKALTRDTPLIVLDDPGLAQTRVGQFNQWLHVREPLGEEGYVAAWFVTR
jgi:outer membrane biosynthesis protein TonB